MKIRAHYALAALALALSAATMPASAQSAAPSAMPMMAPTTAPTMAPLSVAEKTFVARVARELPKRYGSIAAAEKAGYFRYNNEDATGAISYANKYWTAPDIEHPSQLWYDVNGRLLGADYSVRQAESPEAPTRFGIAASRFEKIGQHVHYGLRQADGTIKYGLGMGAKAYTAAGGDAAAPTAAGLVAAGKAKSEGDVAFVFNYDAIWNVSVWVLPNASGAFADLNPAVKPSAARVKNSSEGH